MWKQLKLKSFAINNLVDRWIVQLSSHDKLITSSVIMINSSLIYHKIDILEREAKFIMVIHGWGWNANFFVDGSEK